VFQTLAQAGYIDGTRPLRLQTVHVAQPVLKVLEAHDEEYVLRCIQGIPMTSLTERLNEFLSGTGNEIAFYVFDYPPEDELRPASVSITSRSPSLRSPAKNESRRTKSRYWVRTRRTSSSSSPSC
jgi:hypothetical protein